MSDYSKPCEKWSANNKLIMELNGTEDARGYQQWREVGRQVKQGSKAFYILGPVMPKEKNLAESPKPVSFTRIPVFKIEDTELAKIDTTQPKKEKRVFTPKLLDGTTLDSAIEAMKCETL